MDAPWNDWIPGVLNAHQIRSLCDGGFITGDGLLPSAADLSSLDLSLSDVAYKMTKGSVKPPGTHAYGWFIEHEKLGERLPVPPSGIFNLTAKATYVFKLRERLHVGLADGGIYGQATAKSSAGRVDVLTRLIVDGMDSYEGFTPEGLRRVSGDMYLEITPITFNVLLKSGASLTQLRLFYGNPLDVEMKGRELYKTVFHEQDSDGSLSVALVNETIGGLPVAAFCASPSSVSDEPIPLWTEKGRPRPDPCRHWKFIEADDTKRLMIEAEKFYILRSKERVSVPAGIAIYCRASDETIGEMRIHYAGFVHPLFGRRRKDHSLGTPLIFEVRGHQVNVTLADGEKMANLTFYRMSQDCEEKEDSNGPSPYEDQSLQLSKFFDSWPARLKKVDENGTVERV